MSILEMTALGNSGWIGHSGPDTAKARAFYSDVLGWTVTDMPMQDGSSHAVAMAGDTAIGGFSPTPDEGGSWTIYFTVANVDAALETAVSKGAEVTMPAMDMPGVGRMAKLTDPQGAGFALITYESMAS